MPPMAETFDSRTGAGGNSEAAHVRIRYRIRFAKTGLLKWISHRDLARLWERLLRRADLKLSMTEGFHPKPRISFPSALALGVESHDEVVEIELAEPWDAEQLARRLREDRQPGLEIKRVDALPPQFGKAQLLRSHYAISIPDGVEAAGIDAAIARLLDQPVVTVQRKGKTVEFELAAHVEMLRQHSGTLQLTLAAAESAALRPGDVLNLLGFADWIQQGATITRTGVELTREVDDERPA